MINNCVCPSPRLSLTIFGWISPNQSNKKPSRPNTLHNTHTLFNGFNVISTDILQVTVFFFFFWAPLGQGKNTNNEQNVPLVICWKIVWFSSILAFSFKNKSYTQSEHCVDHVRQVQKTKTTQRKLWECSLWPATSLMCLKFCCFKKSCLKKLKKKKQKSLDRLLKPLKIHQPLMP